MIVVVCLNPALATSFHEAGPIISEAELAGFRDRYEQALAGAGVDAVTVEEDR